MRRKDIEKAFAQLSLEDMNPLLESLTQLRHTKREARVKELQDEIARLNAFGGQEGNGLTASPRVGNGRRAATDSPRVGNGRSVDSPRVGNGLKAGKRASPAAQYRTPDGSFEWSGRGGIPKPFKALGVTDKAGMAKYRIKA